MCWDHFKNFICINKFILDNSIVKVADFPQISHDLARKLEVIKKGIYYKDLITNVLKRVVE